MSKEKLNKNEKTPKNLLKGKSINLLPPLTEEQVVLEDRKIKVNVNSAVAILILIVFTLIIVGYNIFTRLDLNVRKETLSKLETQLQSKSEVLGNNEEILKRVKLYQDIQKSTFSTKNIVDYWSSVSRNLAEIERIDISSDLGFEVLGSTASLNDAARLWYILGNDKRIESIELKSLIKDRNTVKFRFEGVLNFTEFAKQDGT